MFPPPPPILTLYMYTSTTIASFCCSIGLCGCSFLLRFGNTFVKKLSYGTIIKIILMVTLILFFGQLYIYCVHQYLLAHVHQLSHFLIICLLISED